MIHYHEMDRPLPLVWPPYYSDQTSGRGYIIMPPPPQIPSLRGTSTLSCFFRGLNKGQNGVTGIQVGQILASRESSQFFVPETRQQSIADLIRCRFLRSTRHMLHGIAQNIVTVELIVCLCEAISNFGDISFYPGFSLP